MSPPAAAGQDKRPNPKSAAQRSRTAGRAELSRRKHFAEVSPEVGVLDEEALSAAMTADPDGALALLAEMVSATDERLRAAVRSVAAGLVLDRVRVGRSRSGGSVRPRAQRADRGGDLDIDGSMEAISGAYAEARPPGLDELVATAWGRPDLALAVVLDHSGSMNGERLAAAAVTAAACATRAPGQHAVLAFARQVVVLKPLTSTTEAAITVERVLQLRGHGLTSLAGALRAATDELSTARAARRVVILLSDCRATDEEDPIPAARNVPELIILAPVDDSDQAHELARSSGARCAALTGANSAPALLAELLA